jgi:hypothetical protein
MNWLSKAGWQRENDYRTYREVMAACIQVLRPHAEVVTAQLDVLEEEVRRFDPHPGDLQPATAGYRVILCWVELSSALDLALLELERKLYRYAKVGPEMADEGLVLAARAKARLG